MPDFHFQELFELSDDGTPYRQLESEGLVSVEKQGRERVYALQRKYLTDVVGRWLKSFE